MVELHSNFTADGQRQTIDGVAPTNHAEHETVEITQGINDWSEVGLLHLYQRAERAGRRSG